MVPGAPDYVARRRAVRVLTSGGAVGRRRLLVPVLVVSKELVLSEEAAVEQPDDGLAVHVDADEHKLLSCAFRVCGAKPRGRGSGERAGGVAGANLPAVTHLVVRIVLEDLCHLRGGMESELCTLRRGGVRRTHLLFVGRPLLTWHCTPPVASANGFV